MYLIVKDTECEMVVNFFFGKKTPWGHMFSFDTLGSYFLISIFYNFNNYTQCKHVLYIHLVIFHCFALM